MMVLFYSSHSSPLSDLDLSSFTAHLYATSTISLKHGEGSLKETERIAKGLCAIVQGNNHTLQRCTLWNSSGGM